jgi:hypothetical protein
LRAAERGQRITLGIGRDDVRMDIDDGHVRSLVDLDFHGSISTNT